MNKEDKNVIKELRKCYGTPSSKLLLLWNARILIVSCYALCGTRWEKRTGKQLKESLSPVAPGNKVFYTKYLVVFSLQFGDKRLEPKTTRAVALGVLG
ncbi:hypothetical protein NDU88_010345 [Pleurodeles waltl]|uniref:Uncharacterized protein n=1 Tax=Pleurodeles waltl TaxID=8319 RepID=A0AAV7PVF0_PLEWA|nr:hypothetical protein NDU88_010345 [Pleurodeles waltl]